MILLNKYEDFLDRVDELGFMPLSNILPGLPSLSAETEEKRWHTGDRDTDPWCWKDRAAEEQRLAFGCILGGHKGFVSAQMYRIFYTAFHPQESMEERWEEGSVNQTVWQLWQLFEDKTLMNTSEIRREMGVTLKKGGSKVDSALKVLQRDYCITVAGSRRKLNKAGQPYGWPSNIYDKVMNWVPKEWMEPNRELSRGQARDVILDKGVAIGKDINRNELAKILGI